MRLIIIGTLEGQFGAASKIARDRGAKVTQFPTVDSALDALRNGHGAELILMDVRDDIEGLIRQLRSEHINLQVVGCGFEADSKAAVRAIRAGAAEYLPLPPNEELIAAVLEAISAESHSLIYRSDAMGRVVAMAEQIAPSEASVLITGESGTGKEVIAQHIHRKSKRASEPFVAVNCGAIPENLLESELFGHEKGSFTGAVARRIGKFEEANGGTLLLDEISEMDIRLQTKLLRAIQEREIDRVGGKSPVKVNLRILATTNRDLQQEVKAGRFREDLYFRLNVIALHLPPLRDRREDIAALAQHFIAKYADANGVPVRPLTKAAQAKLESYDWPGNVRELENAMHRAVLLATGAAIDEHALLLSGQSTTPAATAASASAAMPAGSDIHKALVGRTVESVERDLILSTLDHCLGNRTHAANILGISIRTLRNKLKQYGHGGGATGTGG
ncbi:MAG: sigma-54-dependent Fis family transcriptional regulator [Alphaproteobacteria bacterium]|nr:sigma-54-dependent Fis family transcriptional regulator [Alphaproteobacteria bacterium]